MSFIPFTKEQIESRMEAVKAKNPYRKCDVFEYEDHRIPLTRYSYDLCGRSFDTPELAERDKEIMAERHERIARLSMEQGHDMVSL